MIVEPGRAVVLPLAEQRGCPSGITPSRQKPLKIRGHEALKVTTCGDDLRPPHEAALSSTARGKRCPPSCSCRPGRHRPSGRQPTCSSTHSATRTRSGTTGSGSARPPSGSARADRWRRSWTTRSARPSNCSGAPRRSTPGTPAGPGCCPGPAGAKNAATRARRCRPGRGGWRCRTPIPRLAGSDSAGPVRRRHRGGRGRRRPPAVLQHSGPPPPDAARTTFQPHRHSYLHRPGPGALPCRIHALAGLCERSFDARHMGWRHVVAD